MDFNLPFGPWKKVFSGKWNDFPIEVHLNKDKELMLLAFSGEKPGESDIDKSPKEGDKENKVLVLIVKPLLLEGNADEFLKSQKRDFTFLEKTIDKKTFKYLLLQAQPFLVEWQQDEIAKAIREERAEIEGLTKVTVDVAANFKCRTTDLSKA